MEELKKAPIIEDGKTLDELIANCPTNIRLATALRLCSAMARVIIEGGHDVYYTGAQGLISDFERQRFGNSTSYGGGEDVDRYFECDLLIIDDLGTAFQNIRI